MNMGMNEPRGGWKEMQQSAEHMLGIEEPFKADGSVQGWGRVFS